jgi:hypothetical protein
MLPPLSAKLTASVFMEGITCIAQTRRYAYKILVMKHKEKETTS